MPASSPEDIINQSLVVLGYPYRIGSVYDGTPAAVGALEIYSQVRDALLIDNQPDWARQDATLALLKAAPADWYAATAWSTAYPPIPWRYEYDLPSDCLVPLQIKSRVTAYPWRPRANPFRVQNNPVTGNYSLLSDVFGAILTYITSLKDPADWHEDFIDLAVQECAKRLESWVKVHGALGLMQPHQMPAVLQPAQEVENGDDAAGRGEPRAG